MYNYGKEHAKWVKNKEKEEKKLRKHGFNEERIAQLREYDEKAFRSERNYKSRENVTKDAFFQNIPSYDIVEINSIEELLDNLEDEHLIFVLNSSDSKTLKIALLLFLDYGIEEIAEMLHLSTNAVYKRIYVLRKRIKDHY